MIDPYTIVGQGIAGTILSMSLYRKGIPFKIVDTQQASQSSRIAAGLANPVVLKRQKWVADAEHYFPFARDFYSYWEREMQESFHHSVAVEHIFHQRSDSNDWHANSTKPNLKNHLGAIQNDALPHILSPQGRGSLLGTFWINTSKLLLLWRNKMLQEGLLQDVEQARPIDGLTIYCNGHLLRESHPILAGAFSPTKGELMIIRTDELPSDRMLHAGVFTLPLGDQLFKVGATYSHHDISENISSHGLDYLKSKLASFFTGSYEIIDQKAGVRPTIKDRKPLLGQIGESQYTFNGMGSRGVLMAPYLAQHFIDHLQKGDPIKAQWDVQRFT